ncbi:GIY-YIG nuclease family protein [Rhizobium sp. CNPSo 4062]|uniref:GIY-YIG nuclease family protein n=1 Tax=Rhizobium sp. CNPSo 4062 TaxID=3021410 RepID=UPI00254B3BD8|nr:GIY-YIG nuclease family protein [Rhizobium sp. CNPSo 4062]MDK4703879.1 GIY-YIG nuclease family protein [Rhizobium sp. CNPSo 4062]
MSIYVLRSAELVKIGYSADLRQRVSSIIASIPVPVEFVGHMPGDRDLEAHLHERFAATRFSGEWFVETDEMRQVFAVILTPKLPETKKITSGSIKRARDHSAVSVMQEQLRRAAAHRFPESSHGDRITSLADLLKWPRSRVKDVYYGDKRVSLRAAEIDDLAYAIAPEIREDKG